MKTLFSLIAILTISLPVFKNAPAAKGKQIIQKSIQKYDPDNKWPDLSMSVRFQEPRLSLADRYSIVSMDHQSGSFKLERNREDKIATYIVDSDGKSKVLIDGLEEFPEAWKDKYRLHSNLPQIYKRSYFSMYGLPMTLNNDLIEEIHSVKKTSFQRQAAYQLEVTLKEPLFAKHWKIYFAKEDYTFLGLEMYDNKAEPNKGERLVFDSIIEINGISIPRNKHWYDLSTNEFLGSDILISLLD